MFDDNCLFLFSADRSWPTSSIFSIHGGGPGPSKVCEQPVGAQADVFIASLGDKNLHLLRKFLENSQRQENQYFIWIKDHNVDKFTVISVKTLENHLKSAHRVRRVKWHHTSSSDMMSVYRYSLPQMTYYKSKHTCDWILRQKKLCISIVWFIFILSLCIIIVLGSAKSDDVTHHYLRNKNNFTQFALLSGPTNTSLLIFLMNTVLV
ncbi:unnamed protein product [Angiostrongylus costaricensis]|uniref:Anoctamin n=1 Tax=Angiostrongylus costaricensis TaxID=334426 RepID=A0A0R3PCV9_ANGCS|nr:unnamed protein product [Angiostrongylus costaricensis]